MTWNGCGSCTVSYAQAFSAPPTVLVTVSANNPTFASLLSSATGSALIQTWNQAGNCDSLGFQFLAVGP